MSTNKPTEAELEILQILWERDQATVREVNESRSRIREVGYTTTLKLMQIMTKKGLLSRRKKGKSHVYKPNYSQSDTQKRMVDRVLQTAFQGSAMSLVLQVLGNKKTSRDELKRIKEYIEKLEGGQK